MAYNFLNLPTKVDFGSGDSIVWVYTVSGAKLRKTVYDNGTVQTTIDYVNGYQYKNGYLDFFAMEAGRVKKTISGALRYEYNLTDHLGNTRVSFADTLGNGTAVILQEDHYYAFGLRIEGLSSTAKDNKFTYNGKELEDEHGLNWYHYGARYYDPQVGRWWAVDPAIQNKPIKFLFEHNLLGRSVFEFAHSNPTNRFDADGMTDWEAMFSGSLDIFLGADAVVAGFTGMVASGSAEAATAGVATIGFVASLGVFAGGIAKIGEAAQNLSNAWKTPDGVKASEFSMVKDIVKGLHGNEMTQDVAKAITDALGLKNAGKMEESIVKTIDVLKAADATTKNIEDFINTASPPSQTEQK